MRAGEVIMGRMQAMQVSIRLTSKSGCQGRTFPDLFEGDVSGDDKVPLHNISKSESRFACESSSMRQRPNRFGDPGHFSLAFRDGLLRAPRRLTLPHSELTLLLSGIDLAKTQHRTWWRRE